MVILVIVKSSSIVILSTREERSYTWCDKHFASASVVAPEYARKIVILYVRLNFLCFRQQTAKMDCFFCFFINVVRHDAASCLISCKNKQLSTVPL